MQNLSETFGKPFSLLWLLTAVKFHISPTATCSRRRWWRTWSVLLACSALTKRIIARSDSPTRGALRILANRYVTTGSSEHLPASPPPSRRCGRSADDDVHRREAVGVDLPLDLERLLEVADPPARVEERHRQPVALERLAQLAQPLRARRPRSPELALLQNDGGYSRMPSVAPSRSASRARRAPPSEDGGSMQPLAQLRRLRVHLRVAGRSSDPVHIEPSTTAGESIKRRRTATPDGKGTLDRGEMVGASPLRRPAGSAVEEHAQPRTPARAARPAAFGAAARVVVRAAMASAAPGALRRPPGFRCAELRPIFYAGATRWPMRVCKRRPASPLATTRGGPASGAAPRSAVNTSRSLRRRLGPGTRVR